MIVENVGREPNGDVGRRFAVASNRKLNVCFAFEWRREEIYLKNCARFEFDAKNNQADFSIVAHLSRITIFWIVGVQFECEDEIDDEFD